MPGNYSKLVTVSTGQLITASERNNEHDNHINNATPAGVDDYSASLGEMQTTADPYPASVASQATTLAGELARLRYLVAQITGEANWYIDPATSLTTLNAALVAAYGALSDAATPASTAASLKVRLDHIVTQIKSLHGETNWYDTPDTSINGTIGALNDGASAASTAADLKTRLDHIVSVIKLANNTANWYTTPTFHLGHVANLIGYRKPNLKHVSSSTVDVEVNTSTSNTTAILFRDGSLRTVTENTASTNKYRRFDITATAEFTSGTEDSGLRSGLSETNNNTYFIYAVKSAINSANFVLVGDQTAPLTTNYATLDSRYGASGWVYLGTIRNGDGSGNAGDIVYFDQSGPLVLFGNNTALSAGINTTGFRVANTAGATSLTWTYAAGVAAAEVPGNITKLYIGAAIASSSSRHRVRNAAASRDLSTYAGGSQISLTNHWIAVEDGIKLDDVAGNSLAMDLTIKGWFDGALGGFAAAPNF